MEPSHLPCWKLNLGANLYQDGVLFQVWAPYCHTLSCEIVDRGVFPMHQDENGYFSVYIPEAKAGDAYYYHLHQGKRPDPVSRYLPESVHGPSRVMDSYFDWKDGAWRGFSWDEAIFYELHVGTFSPEGTYVGIENQLDYLVQLGITVIELLPVAAFPGSWNWGYDGVSLYAPYHGYGEPNALKHFIEACHLRGIGVCLDVVYNHLGPEGNYFNDFGSYISSIHHTPWGEALNFDGPGSHGVREYVIQNALYWIVEFHVDALRLDALHGMTDHSSFPIVEEISQRVEEMARQLGRAIYLIAETAYRTIRVFYSRQKGGFDLQAIWDDTFSDAVEAMITDINSALSSEKIVDFFRRVTFFDAVYFNKHKGLGSIAFNRFIAFLQNHDQVGNHSFGARIATYMSDSLLYPLAFLHILSPFTPLIFMGEEYQETNPFLYFVDFTEENLMKEAHRGREAYLHHKMPFPDQTAFHRSKLSWNIKEAFLHHMRTLIRIRKTYFHGLHVSSETIDVMNLSPRKCFFWGYPERHVYIGVNLETREMIIPLHKGASHVLYSVGSFHIGSNIELNPFSAVVLQDPNVLLNVEKREEEGNADQSGDG